jgi:hypothetical protein
MKRSVRGRMRPLAICLQSRRIAQELSRRVMWPWSNVGEKKTGLVRGRAFDGGCFTETGVPASVGGG